MARAMRKKRFMTPIKHERQECIVYSRVVGWLTPVKNWNKGKKAEFNDRKTFSLDENKYL